MRGNAFSFKFQPLRPTRNPQSVVTRLHGLGSNISGIALTEFAMSLPLMLTAGLYGAETANLALTHMKISQIATHLADNASRIGDTSTIADRAIYEADINDLLAGANLQAGPSIDFFNHGRAIISSLEVFDPVVSCGGSVCPGSLVSGDQFLHWQRCKGRKAYASSYGVAGQAISNGMGPSGEQVTAEPGSAVIFVEVVYDYQPLISSNLVGSTTIKAVSSFVVRSDIDLSGLKQRNPLQPDAPSNCAVNDGYPASAFNALVG